MRPAKPMFPPAADCAAGAMSLDDAAKFLGISVMTLRRIMGRGELIAIYEGRKPRVLRAHLEARLAAQLEAAERRERN